jgi:mRNA-degrading endonuclease toxin of MazEF toxin-antitoxin module
MYDFGPDIGPHPVIVVSRNTNRATVNVVPVTSTAHNAVDVVSLAGIFNATILHGYVRCDQVTTFDRADPAWMRYICTLSSAAMAAVARGIKAALEIS